MHNVASYSRISAALSAYFSASFWLLYKQRNNKSEDVTLGSASLMAVELIRGTVDPH